MSKKKRQASASTQTSTAVVPEPVVTGISQAPISSEPTLFPSKSLAPGRFPE